MPQDARTTLNICDGLKFVAARSLPAARHCCAHLALQDAAPDSYDVVIVDSSDPVGPASVLFTDAFFRSVHRVLRPGGILCTQGECAWLHLDLIKQVQDMLRQSFEGGEVAYTYTSIPTYPSGQIGFMLACKASDEVADFASPQRQPPAGGPLPPLRYYNAAVHRAALALPQFVVDGLR